MIQTKLKLALGSSEAPLEYSTDKAEVVARILRGGGDQVEEIASLLYWTPYLRYDPYSVALWGST